MPAKLAECYAASIVAEAIMPSCREKADKPCPPWRHADEDPVKREPSCSTSRSGKRRRTTEAPLPPQLPPHIAVYAARIEMLTKDHEATQAREDRTNHKRVGGARSETVDTASARGVE